MSDLRLMSREFLTEFINLYRENPCLWKVKSKEYRDKRKKNAAYQILVQKMREVDRTANKEAVVKRINSLRTCFRKEWKKTRNVPSGMDADDLLVYKPNLWYFDLLLFLEDQETPPQDGRDTINHSSVADDYSNITEHEENSNESSSSDTPLPRLSATPSAFSSGSRRSVKRKSQKSIDRSDEVLNIVPNKVQNQGKYAAFGQHLAQELEELSPEMAIYCKKLINDAIFQAQIGKLNEASRIVTDNTETSRTTDTFRYENQGCSLPSETEVVKCE